MLFAWMRKSGDFGEVPQEWEPMPALSSQDSDGPTEMWYTGHVARPLSVEMLLVPQSLHHLLRLSSWLCFKEKKKKKASPHFVIKQLSTCLILSEIGGEWDRWWRNWELQVRKKATAFWKPLSSKGLLRSWVFQGMWGRKQIRWVRTKFAQSETKHKPTSVPLVVGLLFWAEKVTTMVSLYCNEIF